MSDIKIEGDIKISAPHNLTDEGSLRVMITNSADKHISNKSFSVIREPHLVLWNGFCSILIKPVSSKLDPPSDAGLLTLMPLTKDYVEADYDGWFNIQFKLCISSPPPPNPMGHYRIQTVLKYLERDIYALVSNDFEVIDSCNFKVEPLVWTRLLIYPVEARPPPIYTSGTVKVEQGDGQQKSSKIYSEKNAFLDHPIPNDDLQIANAELAQGATEEVLSSIQPNRANEKVIIPIKPIKKKKKSSKEQTGGITQSSEDT